MKFQATKTVTEEIEIDFPFFTTDKYNTHVAKVTEEAVIKVYGNTVIVYNKEKLSCEYTSEVYNYFKQPRITEDEFAEKFIEAIEGIEKLAGVNAIV